MTTTQPVVSRPTGHTVADGRGPRRRRLLGLLVVVPLMTAFAVVATVETASAHPLGNFTVNTYSGMVISPDAVSVTFILDMAEIPAFQTVQEIDADIDGRKEEGELEEFRRRECDSVRAGLDVVVDGQTLPLSVGRTALSFPPGQAGLTTLRLTCDLAATRPVGGAGYSVEFRNSNFIDRVGWREITVAGDRTTVTASTVAATTISAELTRYPDNLLQSPLDQRTASFTVAPGGPPLARPDPSGDRSASPLPRGVDRATQAFSSFVGRKDLSVGVGAVGLLLALVLGAVHALAPGHGKTVMAAYLVGQRGALSQAAMVAATVTVTHTAGVLVLGLAISASAVVAPERLYPYLGLVSGLMLAAIGVSVLVNAARASRRARLLVDHAGHDHADHADHVEHDHAEPGHDHAGHDHAGHDHAGHDHAEHDHAEPEHAEPEHARPHSHGGRSHTHGLVGRGQSLSWGNVVAMGFVGGFLPSPSAVVVLLGAIALGRTWFGVILVVAYGLGMAATLTGAGLLLVRTRGALDRRYLASGGRERLLRFNRLIPSATGIIIVVVGLALALRGFAEI